MSVANLRDESLKLQVENTYGYRDKVSRALKFVQSTVGSTVIYASFVKVPTPLTPLALSVSRTNYASSKLMISRKS